MWSTLRMSDFLYRAFPGTQFTLGPQRRSGTAILRLDGPCSWGNSTFVACHEFWILRKQECNLFNASSYILIFYRSVTCILSLFWGPLKCNVSILLVIVINLSNSSKDAIIICV